jgi:DNA-binding Xre family transcriptional regulator
MKRVTCQLPRLIDRYNAALPDKGKAVRLTQVKLAEATGLSKSLINRMYKNSIIKYDTSAIEKVCHFFNCEICELLNLVDEEGDNDQP